MRPSDYGVCGVILEGGQAETDWNDQSLWVVLLGFLAAELHLDPLLRERFQAHVDAQVAEESGETICDEDDDDDEDDEVCPRCGADMCGNIVICPECGHNQQDGDDDDDDE